MTTESTNRSGCCNGKGGFLRAPRIARGIAAVAIVLIGVASTALAEPAGRQRTTRLTGGWQVDKLKLVDHQGQPFTEERLYGQWTFVLLSDTGCGSPCASALAALTGMRERIAGTTKVQTTQVLFVSVAQESADELRRYLVPFDEHFVGASGSPRAIARLTEDLSIADVVPVSSNAPPGSGDYSGALSLINPDGIVWGTFLPPFDVKMLTARYLKARIGR